MIDDGLIDGFTRVNYAGGYGFKALDPRLTIKGMEFLQENLAMQKIKNSLKDIKFVCYQYNIYKTYFPILLNINSNNKFLKSAQLGQNICYNNIILVILTIFGYKK